MARTGAWAAGPGGVAGPVGRPESRRSSGAGPLRGGDHFAPGRPGLAVRWLAVRWLAALTLAGGAVAVVLVVGVIRRHGGLARPDTAISRWSIGHQTPGWSGFMHAMTYLGDVSIMVPVGLAVVGVAAAAGLRRPAAFIGLSAGSAIAVTGILERVLGTSPASGDPLVLDLSGAFPSGHTAVATAIFGALAAVVATGRGPAVLRWTVVILLVIVVVIVGLSRIYDRAHWPSDVAAGWFLPAVWTVAATVAVGPGWLRHRSGG